MEEESYSLDNSYSVSRPDGDSISGGPASSSSSPGLKLRLVRDRNANSRASITPAANGNNSQQNATDNPVVAVKSRPKFNVGTKNRSSLASNSSRLTSLSANAASLTTSSPSPATPTQPSKRRRESNQLVSKEGKKIVCLPACLGVIPTRDHLTRLPEKEGDDLYVGDIIWSKVSGYPWWPCMITLDPQTSKYTKMGGPQNKPELLYHVQYFGSKALRSYTSLNATMPFQGRKEYELEIERLKNVPVVQKTQRKQALNKLQVKQNYRKEWKFACDEAEEAMKLDRETRIKELTFEYILAKNETNVPVKKEESSKTPKSKKKQKSDNPLNVYDFSDGDEDFDEDASTPFLSLFSHKRASRKGDFNVYAAKERPKIIAECPNLSEAEIDEQLKTRWQLLSEDFKLAYFVRDDKDDKETKTPKRTLNQLTKTPSKRGRKRKSEIKEEKQDRQSNGDITTAPQGNGELSDDENALVIDDSTVAEGALKTPKRNRSNLKEGNDKNDKRSSKQLNVSITAKTPKESKLPKTPGSRRPGRPPKVSVSPVKMEEQPKSTTKRKPKEEPKSTTKRKIKEEPKEASPKKRSSLSKSDTSEKPKRQRKQPATTASLSKENGITTDEPDAKPNKNRKSSIVQQLPAIESEETRTSEDASSLSEIETNEAKENVDKVCEKCSEEAEDYTQCTGPCLRVYHKKCLPKDFNSENSLCQECTSGNHLCFVCKTHSPEVKKCSDSKCGKFYHVKCLQNNYPYRITKDENSEGFICPLHFCLTCYVEHQDDQVHRFMKKRILKCLKCPTAYHFTDHCVSAGAVFISFSYIICPEHIAPKSGKHVNVNWCFSCNTGGSLICCERCPAAFHQTCLESPLPEGSFYCGDCVVRKQLHYGDIVWVKLGAYRWWPGKVCHPKNVPDNVMNLSHSIGEFPVYFFGSHDYYWIHRGRAFHFVEGDLTKAPSLAKGKGNYKDAISEALEAFTEWQEARKGEINSRKIKPPPYVPIWVNKRVGKPKQEKKEDDDEGPNVCSCKVDDVNPCSVDADCFNRLTLIECDSSRCKAGDKCQNRLFRKREYAKVKPFKTESRGWGLKSLEDIKKGQFVIEYVGELINEAECEERIKNMIENGDTNFYFLTIDRETIIDAGPKGNLARFMNHSCSPNCETQKWVVNGSTRVGLFAIQDIPKGSELTFNYNLHCRGNEKTKCNCGAKNCSGFLGVRPNKLPEEESSKKSSKTEKPKKKPDPKGISKKEFESLHEDDCFKCGEGGELVMCDKKKCPKSYHLACLNLEKLPRGLWFCPWHHCDECGKQSARMCHVCPTSFCNQHGNDFFRELENGSFICIEHTHAEGSIPEVINKTVAESKEEIKTKKELDVQADKKIEKESEEKEGLEEGNKADGDPIDSPLELANTGTISNKHDQIEKSSSETKIEASIEITTKEKDIKDHKDNQDSTLLTEVKNGTSVSIKTENSETSLPDSNSKGLVEQATKETTIENNENDNKYDSDKSDKACNSTIIDKEEVDVKEDKKESTIESDLNEEVDEESKNESDIIADMSTEPEDSLIVANGPAEKNLSETDNKEDNKSDMCKKIDKDDNEQNDALPTEAKSSTENLIECEQVNESLLETDSRIATEPHVEPGIQDVIKDVNELVADLLAEPEIARRIDNKEEAVKTDSPKVDKTPAKLEPESNKNVNELDTSKAEDSKIAHNENGLVDTNSSDIIQVETELEIKKETAEDSKHISDLTTDAGDIDAVNNKNTYIEANLPEANDKTVSNVEFKEVDKDKEMKTMS